MTAAVSYQIFVLHVFTLLSRLRFILSFPFVTNNYLVSLAHLEQFSPSGVSECGNQSINLLYGLMDLFLQDDMTGLKWIHSQLLF